MGPGAKVTMSVWARLYALLTTLLGVGTLAVALFRWQNQDLPQFIGYLVLAVAASWMKIPLPGFAKTISAHYLFILIGMMTLDVGQLLVVATACTLSQCLWPATARLKAIQVGFNLASSILAATCGYYAYHSISIDGLDASVAVAIFSAATAFFLVNTFAVAGIVSLTEGKTVWRVWRESFFPAAPQYLMGAALAGVVRICIQQIGWQWSLLATPAMFLIYSSYRLYLERLEEEKKHVSQIADLHLRTIEALAVAIEAKDESTHSHLQRVQVYAIEIAKELGAPEEEMDALRAAALLHDIGKLAVPEYILSKPGRLTPEEFEKIKIHPEVGAEILKHVQFPYPVVPIVAAHHEKWDGSGYPYGLKGDQIPRGARILSAVDCLDALASDRHYRRALPLSEAMAFIVAQSGISFDPEVVSVLQRRYLELECLAHNTALLDHKVIKNSRQNRVSSPHAGFEHTGRTSGEAPNFTFAIAAARQEFQMLHEVTSELGNSLSMEETMSLLGTRLKTVIPHDAIVIYVCREQQLIAQYAHGKDSQIFSSLAISFGEGVSGWVAENRKAIVNGNPAMEPGRNAHAAKSVGLKSAISVPLIGVGGVVGVLTLYHSERDAFTRDHLRLLSAISSKVALTIENALQYREAQKSATTDELTGLPNARSLFLHLDTEVARCNRTNTTLAVLVVDLDGFKLVNDRYGHLAGNKVLKLVALGLKNACREYDYVARMGGDEFVLIVPGMKSNAVRRKAIELSSMVLEAGRAVTGEDILSLSVGEAFFPDDGADTEELLAHADRRMYQVKHSHRAARLHEAGIKELAGRPIRITTIQ
jgi:diguanylate cyclase (GGDEF)-like protein/putative nucleotidyltransferase with HDIG domain